MVKEVGRVFGLVDDVSTERLRGFLSSGVYAIVNLATGHQYIGSASRIGHRWITHQRYLREFSERGEKLPSFVSLISRHAQEYGVRAFAFVVLEDVEDDEEALCRAEQRWIDHFASLDRELLYNKSLTARRIGRRVTRQG